MLQSVNIDHKLKMADKLITLIIGANQGIGFYGAQGLAATGKHHVLLGSRDLSKGKKAVEDIVADTSKPVDRANIEAIQIDCTSDASIYAAAEAVEKQFGRLDIVSCVHGGGMYFE